MCSLGVAFEEPAAATFAIEQPGLLLLLAGWTVDALGSRGRNCRLSDQTNACRHAVTQIVM
jgi:hypothetical protein